MHLHTGDLVFLGVCFFFAVAGAIAACMEWPEERQKTLKQRRRPIGFMDELEARELQRYRKRQVMKQLRETARQAQQEQRRWKS